MTESLVLFTGTIDYTEHLRTRHPLAGEKVTHPSPLSADPCKKQQDIIPLQFSQPPYHFSQRLFFFLSGTGQVSSYLNVTS